MLEVGTKVRIRDDLWGAEQYGSQIATVDMVGFRGQWMTIKQYVDEEESYFLEEDPDLWLWTEEMFSEVKKDDEEHYDLNTAAYQFGFSVGRIGYIVDQIRKGLLDPDLIDKWKEVCEQANEALKALEDISEGEQNGNTKD